MNDLVIEATVKGRNAAQAGKKEDHKRDHTLRDTIKAAGNQVQTVIAAWYRGYTEAKEYGE